MNNILIVIILFFKIKLINNQLGVGYNVKAININNKFDVVIFQTQEFYLSSLGRTINLTFNATNILKTSNNEFIIIGCNFTNDSDNNNIYYQIFNYSDNIYTDDKVHKITISQFKKNNIYIINIYNSTDLFIMYYNDNLYDYYQITFNYKNNEDIIINGIGIYEPVLNRNCKKNILCENIINITKFCLCEGENSGSLETTNSIFITTNPYYYNIILIYGKNYQLAKIDNYNYIICYLNDAKLFCSYIELIEKDSSYIPNEKY